jgi:hypothetical protein
MARNDAKDNGKDGGVVVSVHDIDETTPLLESQTQKTAYVTFPERVDDETWRPSPGFWWIETGAWGNDNENDTNLVSSY